ncbi:MAG: phosphoribosylanthranilate isomerase [Gammaproteobacteria bacterium]
MRLFVKICGLTTPEAVDAAVAAGADAVGFVFHAPSRRNVGPARAAELAGRCPDGIQRVAVMLSPAQGEVECLLAAFRPDALQADAEALARLQLPAGIGRLPVCRSAVEPPPGRILFDARTSGAGLRADWNVASALARRSELLLAGGLDASNVAGAIAAVRPFGVDVSSGVERAPGLKDPVRIRAFIAAARAVSVDLCA